MATIGGGTMTTDIERQFFETFNIKRREYTHCCSMGCTKPNTYCDNCEYHEVYKSDYPKITDRILLELICLNNRHYVTLEDLICPKNIETIKESVLKKFIERNKVFVEEGYSGFCLKTVQALFEEG